MPAHLKKAGSESRKDFDFSFAIPVDGASARFRVNVFHNQGALGRASASFRRPFPASSGWGAGTARPANRVAAIGIGAHHRVTGSGKTTTLAGLVQLINQTGHRRIVTIEEPIEYIFEPPATP